MITTIKALAHGARLIAKHRGNLTAIQSELDNEREWFKFCARHGLNPAHQIRPTVVLPDEPPADAEGATITHLVADEAHPWKGPDLPDPYQ